ncbi:MAG: transcriptional repressor [Desulfobulbaceae bacterium]|nr:MAG: transcriptional repressor [Desulfobulbaceae bacterium]
MDTNPKIRMTKQRQVILEELCKVTSHPTADEMYQMIRKRLPKVSLGTVYRNLEILSELGMVLKLDVGGTQKRFDGNVENHYHVRCTECGRVGDLHMPTDKEIEQKAQALTDFQIKRHSVEFIGVCPECREAGNRRVS